MYRPNSNINRTAGPGMGNGSNVGNRGINPQPNNRLAQYSGPGTGGGIKNLRQQITMQPARVTGRDYAPSAPPAPEYASSDRPALQGQPANTGSTGSMFSRLAAMKSQQAGVPARNFVGHEYSSSDQPAQPAGSAGMPQFGMPRGVPAAAPANAMPRPASGRDALRQQFEQQQFRRGGRGFR